MNKYYIHFLLWLSAIACIILVFPNLSLHPNSSLISVWNDGIKNYFTTLFYIDYNEGNHFSGMNYPFGEHIVFTDNMPAFARPIQWLGQYVPWVKQHSLGAMNLTLLFSIVLAAHFVFKTLRHYKVPGLFAIISALFIVFCAPQLNRITAHYGMSILWYLPAIIYFIIRYFEGQQWRYLLYISLVSTIAALFHLYNLAIILVFIGFVTASNMLLHRFSKKSIRQSIWMLFFELISVGLSYSYVLSTDTVKDRPTYPYEALGNEATLNDIFVNDTPLGHIFQFLFGTATPVISTEGKSYIGLVSILVFICLTVLFIKRIIRYKSKAVSPYAIDKPFKILLLAALFQLLFSMAIPFIVDRDFFIDHISVFRQFRALGRFIWPFYFVIMMFCTLFIADIYKKLRAKKKNILATGLLTTTMLIWLIQAYGYVQAFKLYDKEAKENYTVLYSKAEKSWPEWLKEKGYEVSDFQAVLGLPFFHYNSDKIWIDLGNVGRNEYELCKLSLQTGIPMINTLLARTSWGQTFANIQLLDGPFNPKEVLDKFDDRPVLLYVEKIDKLNPDKEKEWMDKARFLGSWSDEIDMYLINPKQLQAANQRLRDTIRQIAEASPEQSGLAGIHKQQFYYANNFKQNNTQPGFADPGMLLATDEASMIVDRIELPADRSDSIYTISIWAKCNMKDFRTPYFEIYQFDSTGKQIGMVDFHTKATTNVIQDWFKAETNFKIEAPAKYMIIKAFRGWNKPVYTGLDNLLLQPSQSIHFYKSPLRGLLLNNRPQ
ncbi:MAG: hypothetical protein BGO31_11405 [Bacteroidetes bacterium 43-16]|nr:MAG: hypothetical protein BGO31_11405 [Bacteroidetes bacterium 43-16]